MGVIDVLDSQRHGSAAEGLRDGASGEYDHLERAGEFHRLADQHLDHSYRLAAVVLGSEAEARDAVHDAFVTAWRKYDSLRDRGRLEAWFDRIVVNTCRDRLRHAKHLRTHDLATVPEVVAVDPTSTMPDEIIIHRALGRLRPDDRVVLALRFYRDMKVDDIAAAMGIRPRAATSRLHRALERLRRILEDDGTEVAG